MSQMNDMSPLGVKSVENKNGGSLHFAFETH